MQLLPLHVRSLQGLLICGGTEDRPGCRPAVTWLILPSAPLHWSPKISPFWPRCGRWPRQPAAALRRAGAGGSANYWRLLIWPLHAARAA